MKHTTTSKNPLCECDNCGYRARYNSLPPAKDIEERCADPRDEYSDVECPQCGALCFEVKPRPLSRYAAHAGETETWIDVAAPSCTEAEKLHAVYSAALDLLNALEIAEATIQRIAPDGSRATQGTRDVIRTAIAKALGK